MYFIIIFLIYPNIIYLANINYYLPRTFSKFRSFRFEKRRKKYSRAGIFRVCLRREMHFPVLTTWRPKKVAPLPLLPLLPPAFHHWSRKLFREAREKAAARNKSLAFAPSLGGVERRGGGKPITCHQL